MSNPPPTVTIEQVKETDFSLWLPHWRDYQTFYKVALSEAITQTTWRRFFDRQEPLYCAVARRAKTCLALCTLYFIVPLGRKLSTATLKICLSPQRRGASLSVSNWLSLFSKRQMSETVRACIGIHMRRITQRKNSMIGLAKSRAWLSIKCHSSCRGIYYLPLDVLTIESKS